VNDQEMSADNTLQSFEAFKRTNEHGAEFWSARDLQDHLGYSQWRRFEDAIARAKQSCEASGNVVENHFTDAGKMVSLGSGAFGLGRWEEVRGGT
jgi:DNA-damage-inducible protein D